MKRENYEIQAKKMNLAYTLYLTKLRNKLFNALKNFYFDNKRKEDEHIFHRFLYLKKSVLRAWANSIPELMDENYEQDKKNNEKIYNFRFHFMCPKIFKDWKGYIQESKEEKLKEMYTQVMWEKAQLWLSELKNE